MAITRQPTKRVTKPAAVKSAPAKRPAAAASPPPASRPGLLLRGEKGLELPLHSPPNAADTRSWAYVLRHRHRWVESKPARDDLASRALRTLETLGVTASDLERFAGTCLLEVQIPFVSEIEGWAERIFPWEFVLHSAMTQVHGAQPLLVVRYLKCPGGERRTDIAAANGKAVKPRLMVIESMPGKLVGLYGFETLTNEEKLVTSNLSPAEKPVVLANPTLERLAAEVADKKPDIIHLAGIDSHQARQFLGRPLPSSGSAESNVDGVVLADKFGNPLVANILEIASALNAYERRPPRLVAFNFYNTAARLAAMTVARGAGASIGFQDEVDDIMAEQFFARFYQAWRLSKDWDLLEAFRAGAGGIGQQRNVLTGSGVVLWSRSSLIPAPAENTRRDVEQIATVVQKESSRVLTNFNARDAIRVEIDPCKELNYSLLHNNRNVFNTFKIMKVPVGVIRGVNLEVELHAGAESFPFRVSQDLKGPVWDANRIVRVPLTSSLARSLQESVKTSLFVRVSCGSETVYQKTHQVTLLPVDQWQDTQADRVWLPSFVLPRDPSVARIVDAAQRYLIALTDRIEAGFAGYQKVDWGGAADFETSVDLQVRALWWALLNELPLSYINPPPTFTYEAQRLRTPAEVVEGRRGTCLDLALAVAACLEYIDVHPVVFLYTGHAYPGYCRTEAAHRELAQLFYSSLGSEADERSEAAAGDSEKSRAWMLGQDAYEELMQLVEDGKLVPIETVALTRRQGFRNAVDQAIERLRNSGPTAPERFEWIFDIKLARDNDVTPLPLR